MINDCVAGMVDVILTKSISGFSRNLVDTLQYVRMLKDKGIAVIFEKENINTLSMESEMALALLSTLAQNEVGLLSANIKLGIKMKMKRGELMGFNACLGYDYHPDDKSITVNQEEAVVVREMPIVSPKIWDAAQEIKKSRYRRSTMSVPGIRKKYSRKFAFSSVCKCVFCGKYMTRRIHN